MFDTMKLALEFTLTDAELRTIPWSRVNTTQHNKSNSPTKFYHLTIGKGLPRLMYNNERGDGKNILTIEVSIPKLLYGNNVQMVTKDDIPAFFLKLRRTVADALGVDSERIPDLTTAKIKKLHVCYNFDVGSLKRQYLKTFMSVEKPRYERTIYGNESIQWKCESRVEKVYDKETEVLVHENNSQLAHMAKNIIRYEIELSYREIKMKNELGLAGELLDFDWASSLILNGLGDLGFMADIHPLNSWIEKIDAYPRITPGQKNVLVSFVARQFHLGEDSVRKSFPPSTYYRLRKLLRDIGGTTAVVISDTRLPPLSFNPCRRTCFSDRAS